MHRMGLRDEIKLAAERWGMGAGELSRLTKISRWSIRRYLAGEIDLAGERIDKLMMALSMYATSHKTKGSGWGDWAYTPPPKRAQRKVATKKKRETKPRGEVDPLD